MHHKSIITALLLLIPGISVTLLHGQLHESFDGPDLNGWVGDTLDFILNDEGQLQLMADSAGESKLFRLLVFPDPMSWTIDVSLDFAPSSNNRLVMVLAAESPEYRDASALWIEIGESGAEDAIRLFRSDHGETTQLGSGRPGTVSNAFDLTISFENTADSTWMVISMPSDNPVSNIEFETKLPSSILNTMNYTGFICHYTTSNTDAFRFDNFRVEKLQPDTSPPLLTHIEAIDSRSLELAFSEAIDSMASGQSLQVEITTGIMIDSLCFNQKSNNEITLFLSDNLNACQNYQIAVSGIFDLNGLSIKDTIAQFNYAVPPLRGDIIINEVLADPVAGGTDFIELYNVSDRLIDLSDCVLANLSRSQFTPLDSRIVMAPHSFLCLTNDTQVLKQVHLIPDTAMLMEIDLPAFNNSSGTPAVLLEEPSGNYLYIDTMRYEQEMHLATLGSGEGFSLERVQAMEWSHTYDNWASCGDKVKKATPGYTNSNAHPLKRYKTRVLNDHTIEVCFRQLIKAEDLWTADNFSIDDISPDMLQVYSASEKCVLLWSPFTFESGQLYELSVNKLTTSCGRILSDSSSLVRLVEKADPSDLVINEILFNPVPEHYDFIELMNTGDRFVTLDSLVLSNENNDDVEILRSSFILSPGEIVALTHDPKQLSTYYNTPEEANIIQARLPAFNNDSGNITVYRLQNELPLVVDAFDYSDEMHFELLESTEGVSLERISSNAGSQSDDNWFSGAEAKNFATPGYRNTATQVSVSSQNMIDLSYRVFSPDSDGHKDLIFLNYSLNKPGFVANIDIFDDRGFRIKELCNNKLLAREGSLYWDGANEDSRMARIGIYIIRYHLFHPDGDILKGKKLCILAQQLD